jgi:hypothetical protein
MAAISSDPNGRKRIRFVASDGKQKTIRLGKATMKQAEAFKVKVEALIGWNITGVVDDEVSRWLSGLSDVMYSKLAAVDLVKPRQSPKAKLGPFLSDYIASRTDVKQSTINCLQRAERWMVQYFGQDRDMRKITPEDAKKWRAYMVEQNWLTIRFAATSAGPGKCSRWQFVAVW